MAQRITGFNPSDRYTYDNNKCSYANGWAQIDTPEDAHYFGIWINPIELKIFSYIEGDISEFIADNQYELMEEFERIVNFYQENGENNVHIDPGLSNTKLKEKLYELGFEKYLH
jgi:hypothetical protein